MKNLILSNVPPCEGYIVEIDGKFESEYGTLMGALRAGLELKKKFPHSQVKVHDADEQAPADVQSEKKKKLHRSETACIVDSFRIYNTVGFTAPYSALSHAHA